MPTTSRLLYVHDPYSFDAWRPLDDDKSCPKAHDDEYNTDDEICQVLGEIPSHLSCEEHSPVASAPFWPPCSSDSQWPINEGASSGDGNPSSLSSSYSSNIGAYYRSTGCGSVEDKPDAYNSCRLPPNLTDSMSLSSSTMATMGVLATSAQGSMVDDGIVTAAAASFAHGKPCDHWMYWKRLRAKKGIDHMMCCLCGSRWKAPRPPVPYLHH